MKKTGKRNIVVVLALFAFVISFGIVSKSRSGGSLCWREHVFVNVVVIR